jgi:hypothetical protein
MGVERCDTGVPLANATCVNGCQAITCSAGYMDCDTQAATGCEINVNSDKNNCGTCSNKCGAFDHCENGQCVF